MSNAIIFNAVDLVALAFIAVSVLIGVKRGLSGELAKLIATAVALGLSILAYRPLGAWMEDHTRLSDQAAQAAAFLATALAALVVTLLVQAAFKHLLEVAFEGVTDRIGGGIAGFLGGTLTVLIVFIVMNLLPHDYLNRQFGERSALGTQILKIMPSLREKLEDIPAAGKVLDRIDETADALDGDGRTLRRRDRDGAWNRVKDFFSRDK